MSQDDVAIKNSATDTFSFESIANKIDETGFFGDLKCTLNFLIIQSPT